MTEKDYKRKLTTLLRPVVKEYSRLMREDEDEYVRWYAAETLERLNTPEAVEALNAYRSKSN